MLVKNLNANKSRLYDDIKKIQTIIKGKAITIKKFNIS